MSIPKRNARNVLQDSTAAAAVWQTPITSRTIDDSYELGCEMERKRVECAIMIKAAMAERIRGIENMKKRKEELLVLILH